MNDQIMGDRTEGAMKIVTRGTLWWHGRRLTCDRCGSVIELEEDRDQHELVAMTKYPQGAFVLVTCPICGAELRVYRDDVPSA